jgi:hypothetical protein
MEHLLEWAALVCSLSGKPLRNLTTSFINNEPFHIIYSFYFPAKGVTLPQTYMRHLSSLFGISFLRVVLWAGAYDGLAPQFHDVCTIVTTLALLASRIVGHNDRIDVAYSLELY